MTVISCSNISACIFLKIFVMFEYLCMHLFSKTKCIFKYKCMHVFARGYDIYMSIFISLPSTAESTSKCPFVTLILDVK